MHVNDGRKGGENVITVDSERERKTGNKTGYYTQINESFA